MSKFKLVGDIFDTVGSAAKSTRTKVAQVSKSQLDSVAEAARRQAASKVDLAKSEIKSALNFATSKEGNQILINLKTVGVAAMNLSPSDRQKAMKVVRNVTNPKTIDLISKIALHYKKIAVVGGVLVVGLIALIITIGVTPGVIALNMKQTPEETQTFSEAIQADADAAGVKLDETPIDPNKPDPRIFQPVEDSNDQPTQTNQPNQPNNSNVSTGIDFYGVALMMAFVLIIVLILVLIYFAVKK